MMRTVPGFQRAGVQRAVLALCVVLIGVTIVAALAVRRSADAVRALNAAIGDLRSEIAELDSRLARERSTREALALELARQRSGAGAAAPVPTLTLYPMTTRSGEAPARSVSAPAADQVVELRLVLPDGAAVEQGAPLEVALREWSSGRTIWSRSGLRPGRVGSRVAAICHVTGDVLRPGAYEVLVRSGAGDLAAYDMGIK